MLKSDRAAVKDLYLGKPLKRYDVGTKWGIQVGSHMHCSRQRKDAPEPQESGKPGALVEQRGDWLDESPVNQAESDTRWTQGGRQGQALWGKECRTEAEFIYLILSLHIDFLIPVLWNLDFRILQHRIINNTAIKTLFSTISILRFISLW